jgi:SAM-dependent methyltransferase
VNQPDPLFAATASRYRCCGRAAYSYVNAKLRHDPVHRSLLQLAFREPFGDVLDIGCGRGQLSMMLLQSGLAESVRGIDRNAKHLRQAEIAAHSGTPHLNFRTRHQDLSLAPDLPPADAILLIDVLYQLDTTAQLWLLKQAARRARRRLLIRTSDPDRGFRSAVTAGWEILSRRLSPHAGAHVNPLPIHRIAGVLAAETFAVETAPCWRGTPFANVLIIARRVPPPQAAGAEHPAAPRHRRCA